MNWKDLATSLTSLAPTVGSFFGPVGTGVGAAVSALAKAFGLKPDAKPDEILEAIKADPQALLKLQMAKMDYELAIEKENTEKLRIELGDTKDARGREVEITKTLGTRDINLYILAWVVVVGFFILVGMMMYLTVPGANIGPVNQLFGALAAGFGLVLGYFFGSSRGSALKSQAMQKTGAGV